jgi:hypothetical protein
MNDEAESSRAALRRNNSSPDRIDDIEDVDPEEIAREHAKTVKERRLDAKRKRIRMLGDLLRELDLVVYMELLALYHLEYAVPSCSHTILGANMCIAAHSSGLQCVHWLTVACLRQPRTQQCNAHRTNLDRSYP